MRGVRCPRLGRGRRPRGSSAVGVAGLAIALLLPGCAQAAAPTTSTVVEVDVFSGRRNPSWEMTDDELAGLRAAIERLDTPSSRATPHGGGLGFRGFVVHDIVLTGAAAPVELTVIEGAVIRQSGDPATWSDPTSSVLALLVDDARSHLDPADLDAIGG